MTREGATIQALLGHIEALNETIEKQNKHIKELEQTKDIGHYWIANFRFGMYPGEKHFICSKCSSQSMDYSNYCPNCGEKMK